MREAVFNILAHGIPDFALDGAQVLDLFAGTGALGLEALSRGAAYCLFVEEEAQARAPIRRNVEAFGLTGITKIFRRDATDSGPRRTTTAASRLVFLDPPYGKGLAERALASAASGGWLAPGRRCRHRGAQGRAPSRCPPDFAAIDQRSWGDTQVLFARYRGARS